MSKHTSVKGYYVRVEPFPYGPEDSSKALCAEIMSAIKRHVDGAGHIEVMADEHHTCEHCGHEWTEYSSKYNGGCCEKDELSAPLTDIPGVVAGEKVCEWVGSENRTGSYMVRQCNGTPASVTAMRGLALCPSCGNRIIERKS